MTIKDIARLSGYAVGTVSRVLNNSPGVSDKARAAVMAVVEEHQFKLNSNAKHLKQQTSSGVAIIVKGTQNMLFASIVERMQSLIKDGGYPCLIYYIDEDEDEVQQAIKVNRERRPFGFLFLGSNATFFENSFSAITVPCVLVTNSAQGLHFDNLSSVSTDDEAASMQVIETFVSLGHRNIGILGGQMDVSHAAYARFHGCQKAFRKCGISFDQDRQYEVTRFNVSDGYRAMGCLLDKTPNLTAVFAMSDVQAIGAVRALHERGLRVPEDISIVGFDGIELAGYVIPSLATVRQNARQLSDRSVEILLGQIQEGGVTVHELIPYELVPGESVRPLTDQNP